MQTEGSGEFRSRLTNMKAASLTVLRVMALAIILFVCFAAAGGVVGLPDDSPLLLESEAHRDGDRVGIPLAGDDREAVETAASLVRDAGFDPVIVGALERGKEFEPGTPPYNTGMSGRELRELFG